MREYRLNIVEKSMLAFGIINIVYYFVSFLWQTPESTNFGNVLCSIFPMYLFYVLAAHGVITRRSLTIFILLSCVAGFFYFSHAQDIYIQSIIYGEEGNFTVNASTIFLVIIPLLFLVRNKWIVLGVSAVIIFFIIYGAKRGNIVSAAIPFYLLIIMNMKSSRTLKNEILLIIVVAGLSYFAFYIMNSNDYVMKRIDMTMEGDTSGRESIYSAALHLWLNADSIINILLGFGTDATEHLMGIRAHNDWLEILVNFGMLGVVCYLVFFFALLRYILNIKNIRELRYALSSVFFIWFSKSLYSMGFTEETFYFLSMTIGIIMGLDLKQKNDYKISYSNATSN